jgi:hypothetical protein
LIRAQYMFEYIPQLHAHARAHGPRPRGRHASPLSGRTSCDVSIPFANIEKQKERERERERKAFDLVSRFNWQTYVYTYIYIHKPIRVCEPFVLVREHCYIL